MRPAVPNEFNPPPITTMGERNIVFTFVDNDSNNNSDNNNNNNAVAESSIFVLGKRLTPGQGVDRNGTGSGRIDETDERRVLNV